jgi:hypothetical protein
MADGPQRRPHVLVREHVENREYTPAGGGGDPKIREVEFRAHGEAMQKQLAKAIKGAEDERKEIGEDELRALGTTIVLEASDAAFPLKLESLDRRTRHPENLSRRPFCSPSFPLKARNQNAPRSGSATPTESASCASSSTTLRRKARLENRRTAP